MRNSLTATVLAAALATTTFTATPAQASDESDTIAALIFGAAALWAVIEATDDDNKSTPAPVVTPTDTTEKTHRHSWGERHRHAHAHKGHIHNDAHAHNNSHSHSGHSHNGGNQGGSHGGHSSNDQNSKVLPGQCQRTTEGRKADSRDQHTYFSSKCLAKNDADDGLPSSCEKVYYTDKGRRDGYATTCLMRKGYVIGRS